VIALIGLMRALSGVLIADRSKLERCANATHAPHARSAVGRAVVSITIGSILALECLPEIVTTVDCFYDDDDKKHRKENDGKIDENTTVNSEKDIIRRAVWSALISLKMVVHLSPKPPVSESTATPSPTAATPPSSAHILPSSYASPSAKCHTVPCAATAEMWGSSMLKIVGNAGQMDFPPPFNAPEKSGDSGIACSSSSHAQGGNDQCLSLAAACEDVSRVAFPGSSDESSVSMVFSSILTAEGAVAGGHDLVDTPPADVSPPPKRTRRMPRRKQQQSAMAESTAIGGLRLL